MGRLAAGGGGNAWVETWLTGADWTDPVTSAGADVRDA
jgi:hypothetical protein